MNNNIEDAADRHHFLTSNIDKARGAFRQSTANSPVVVVTDLRDKFGREIAAAFSSRQWVDEQIRQYQGLMIPTAVIAMPAAAASIGFSESSPKTADLLTKNPPDGHFWCVGVCGGRSRLAAIPIQE